MTVEELRASNEKVLMTFITKPYWEDEEVEKAIINKDCVFDFPYAPPGMPKTFPRSKHGLLKDWWKRTTKNWSAENIIVHPTTDPSRFWAESHTHAEVTWGGPVVRPFDCQHIQLIVIEDGKVTLARTWSDPLAYYLAAGINLPVFHWSGPLNAKSPEWKDVKPPIPQSEEEAHKLREKLFMYFLEPDSFDPERDTIKFTEYFDPEYSVKLPYMPVGMMRNFTRDYMEACRVWVMDTEKTWNHNFEYHRDQFLNPDIAIVENNGSWGLMQWDPNGNVAGYTNDYVLMVKIKDFRLLEFREYLDPIQKLVNAGAQCPVFPWYY